MIMKYIHTIHMYIYVHLSAPIQRHLVLRVEMAKMGKKGKRE